MIRFKTKRLIIRDVEEKDYMFLLSIYTEPVNMRFIPNGRSDWTLSELKDKYNRANENYANGFGIFVVEMKDHGFIIGEAGLFDSFNNTSTLELGYILDSDFWKQGFGSELCAGLINYCFTNLHVDTVVARTYADNIASVKLSEKLGMGRTETGVSDDGKAFYRYELSSPH